MKKNIAVFFGGVSGEHEVSLVSAASIIAGLKSNGHNVIPVGIKKDNTFISSDTVLDDLKSGSAFDESHIAVLSTDKSFKGLFIIDKGSLSICEKIPVDVIFPVLHGTYGEDGVMQGLFEMSGVPYVGCDVISSSCAMDKVVSKRLFKAAGLNIVPDVCFSSDVWKKDKAAVLNDCESLGYNLFVKPANTGSSVGISKAHNRLELVSAIEEAFRFDRRVQVEKSVENAREIEVAVLGNEDVIASIPGEVVPCNEFYDYKAKYEANKSKTLIPAELPADVISDIREKAVTAYKALNCCGLARADFMLSGNELFINELNTLPGFTSISMYPKLWEATGIPYRELLERLIVLAEDRFSSKKIGKFDVSSGWFKE